MIEQTLRQTFGYDSLRPGQEQAIRAVVAGRSAAAIFPTGSGKSLCYQLPALLLPHLTLVVSPLLALMQDQLAFLHRHGIAAASIDSAQSREQTSETMARAKSGELKILMISVERLKNERFRHFISQVPISLLVVDEAHCISEWGHNFRPDYLKLPDYQRQFNIPQALLLTATATPPVIADMQAKFSIAADDVVTTGFYRPNLNLLVEPVSGFNKQRRLVEWLTDRAGQPTIVYVTQQKTAEQIAEHLAQRGFPASAYHAGMAHELRESIQRRFMAGELNCIVATIAFGMGIDKADIRNVVHYDLPKSVENYSQEIGRAGRDGNASDCLVLANRDSLSVLQNFVYGDTPEREGIRCVLDELLQAGAGGAMGADAQPAIRSEQHPPAAAENPAGAAGAARHHRTAFCLLRRVPLQVPARARCAGSEVRRRAATVRRSHRAHLGAGADLVHAGFRSALRAARRRPRAGGQGAGIFPGEGLDRAGEQADDRGLRAARHALRCRGSERRAARLLQGA